MKLRTWLDTNGISVEDFARSIDHSEHAVRKWLQKQRIPGEEAMGKIARQTNGEVTPNDFYDLPAQSSEGAAA